MPTAVVLGNCQAQLIEAILIQHTDWIIHRIPPVFMLSDDQCDEMQSAFASADYIFAQRVSDRFSTRFVRTSHLKEHFPQTISWPNIYFSGYFPDIEYIYLDGIGKLVGPLDDYHPTLLLETYCRGGSVGNALDMYKGDGFHERFPDPIEMSLGQLVSRENGLDTHISDYVRDGLGRQKLFYTVNHPINDLLFEMAERLLARSGHPTKLDRYLAYSLSRVNIPVYESVFKRFGLNVLPHTSFVGIDRTNMHAAIDQCPARVYLSQEEAFDAFFRFYDTVFPRNDRGFV